METWAATSYVQDGVWLMAKLHPGAPAHQLCRAFRVTGQLRLDVLRAAWRSLLDRHTAWRTTLVEVDGRPLQRIAAARDDSFLLVDAASEPDADRLCTIRAAEPLDLTEGPLARLIVIRVSTMDHRIMVVAHRAVADEHSMSIAVAELSSHYAMPGDRAPVMAEPPCQYVDYARWQRGQETAGHFRHLLEWWTAELSPPPPLLALPADRGPGAGPAPGADVLGFDWGGQLATPLRALVGQEGTTAQVVLLAALQVLLSRHSGEPRLAVGLPVAVRPRPEFDALVGPCENLVPVLGDLSGGPIFRQLVRRLTRAVERARAHRELPFPRLVQALAVDRDPRGLPLCGAVLAVTGGPAAEPRLPGATVQPLPIHSGSSSGGLALTVDPASLTGHLSYQADRLDRASAAGLLGQLRSLLDAALERPDRPVASLPLEPTSQVRAAVREADQIGAAPAIPHPVHRLVSMRAAELPETDAVGWDGGGVSYRSLERTALAIAGRLRALGGVAGAAVAVRMAPGPWQIAASLGVLHTGAHLSWFSPGDAGDRGRAVLTDLRPACLLLDGDPNGDPLASWYRDELGGRVVNLTTLTLPEPVPAAGGGWDEVAYVAYTAGSTGRPKGVAQSHAAFAQFVTWLAAEFGIGAGSRVAQWAALEHDPSLCEVFAALVGGGTICPVPARIRAHPEKLLDWLARERITLLQTIPSFARELLAVVQARRSAEPLASLTTLILMGETLPADLANALRAALPWVRLANIYGPTETVAATWCDINAAVTSRTAPIGRPLPGRQVLVLDERDQPCAPGVVGEIVVRSPYAVAGYRGEPPGGPAFRPVDGPAGAVDAVRSYRTGDLGRRRWDGLLEFCGRRDLQVKLAGLRVELAEVEAVLAGHESIADCAVAAVTDPGGLTSRLVAYVVPRRTSAGEPVAGAEQWRAHLRRRFGTSMVRVTFAIRHTIPRNLAGKVDRRRLPDPRQLVETAAPAPRDQVEQGMAEIWSELALPVPATMDDSFFALGGHSLLVPRLVGLVRERFGVEIRVADCLANPTLASMSAVVRSACSTDRYAPPPREEPDANGQ
jgi:amino acid adenylation domain-containing protein